MNKLQDRVGELLRQQLPYVFKPTDGPYHGGAARLDYLGCDGWGRFWAVEVKAVPATRKHYNPEVKGAQGLSPLQRQALYLIAEAGGRAIVAVWRGPKELYFFDYADLITENSWEWERAVRVVEWTGPKSVEHLDLVEAFYAFR